MIGSHARWTARGTSASRSSSSSTTCPAPIRQALWVGNQSTREPTDPVVCLWAPLGITQRAQRGIITWSNWVPVKGLSSCGQFAHLNQIVCAFGSMFNGVGWSSSATLRQSLHRSHCAVTAEQQKVLPSTITEELEPLHHFALRHQTSARWFE